MTCIRKNMHRQFLPAILLGLACALPAQAMTLTEALQLANQHDPAVAVSAATYDADREAGPQERGTLYPSVGASVAGSYANTNSKGVFGNTKDSYPHWSAGIQAKQPLFRLDWSARGDRAAAEDDLADAGLADRKQQTMRRVAERYFGVLVAQDELALAEAEAHAVRESLEDTRKRYEVELVPGTDLKEAQARDDLSQAALLSARRTLETAQDALDETTGNGRAALPRLAPDVHFPPLTPADAESWVAAAGEHSPVIRAAKQQVEVAKANISSRKSEAAPALDLVASVNHNDNSKYRFGQQVDDERVGVELNVPIYAGGINSSRVRQAEAVLRTAEADAQRVKLETERLTRQLFRDVQTAYAQEAAFQKALASAETAQEATRNGYDAGTRTITAVLDAKSRVVQAHRDLNQTRYKLLLNLLQLKQNAGVLTEQDFTQIDQLLQISAAVAPTNPNLQESKP